MAKVKLLVVGAIALVTLGIFFTSCMKEFTCYCETSTITNSFSKDLNSALNEVIKQKNGNCADVASNLRSKGYANVSCSKE